jgi:hypothetical protein
MKNIAEIDFERVVQERNFNPHNIQLNQLYQIIREEAPNGTKVTLDEVKNIVQHVREKSGDD